MDPLPKQGDDTDLVTAMLGGAAAGVMQTVITYPFEFLKTSQQLQNKMTLVKLPSTSWSFRPLFAGCLPLAVGNSLKAATRMCIFNTFSDFMATENGNTTAPRVVVAGLMTGFVETLWVIPFENIKTRMIENSLFQRGMVVKSPDLGITSGIKANSIKTTKRPARQQTAQGYYKKLISPEKLRAINYYRKNPSVTFTGIVKEIYKTDGLSGFKKGSLITVFRQCMNSMVWYSTYSSLRQFFDPNRDSISELDLFGMSVASSAAVVAVTQPIDLLKTRLQMRDYRFLYKDFMTCAYQIFVKEGLTKFWCGWFPRFIKIACSSYVTLDTYEFTVNGINKLKAVKPFSAS